MNSFYITFLRFDYSDKHNVTNNFFVPVEQLGSLPLRSLWNLWRSQVQDKDLKHHFKCILTS